MGVIRSCFKLMMGTVCGVYIAQNYNVPNIKKLANRGLCMAKQVEQNYRKPQPQPQNKPRDDDLQPPQ